MSDPSLSRPPWIPEGTFRCCLCLDVFTPDAAWQDRSGQRWDVCKPCKAKENPDTDE